MKKTNIQAEPVVLWLLTLVSGVVAFLHLVGLLDHPWLAERIPSLTLLCVALVAGSLALQQRAKIDNLERLIADSAERLIQSLRGVDVKVFSETRELYRYVAKRMKEAKSIDDLTWGLSERERTPESQKAYEEYVSTIPKVCAKGSVTYREVMSFPAENSLKRADSLIRQGTPGYHLRYYEVASGHMPPLISFMVVDSEEVIFAFYRSGLLPSDKEIRLAVRHPEIVRLFADYYDAIWQGATRLEGSQQAALKVLQEIKSRFPSSS
jgi:hypothetical protein